MNGMTNRYWGTDIECASQANGRSPALQAYCSCNFRSPPVLPLGTTPATIHQAAHAVAHETRDPNQIWWKMSTQRDRICPKCGASKSIPIAYRYPSSEMVKAAEKGKV